MLGERDINSIRLRGFRIGMENIIFSVIVLLLMSDATFSNNMLRGLKMRIPMYEPTRNPFDDGLYYENSGILFNPDKLSRDDRALIREPQPLCREIRTELPASLYVPNLENAEIYTFRPRRIYMVNCSREETGLGMIGDRRYGCRPENCREKFVDIDIFGKPKTVKENLWQLMMEISSVPIACECFKIP